MKIYSKLPRNNYSSQLSFRSCLRLLVFALVIFLPIEMALAKEEKTDPAKSREDYPLVESVNLDTNIDVPWSEPIIVKDPFEEEFIGIFDRNYFSARLLNTRVRIEVISLWSADHIRFLLAFRNQTASKDCLRGITLFKVTNVYLKIGDKVVILKGKNNIFPVNDELAKALKNLLTKELKIRLVAENGKIVDSVIGEKTVRAWQEIF